MKSGKTISKSIMAVVMASTSFTYMNVAKAAQAKGPNQLMEESRSLLFKHAYRIDKELIGHSDSESTTKFSKSSSSESSGGTVRNPFTTVAGGVIGGLLGGAGALALGGVGGIVGLAAGGGALVGGSLAAGHGYQEKSISSDHFDYSRTDKSESNTYQIHGRANTWAIIVIDAEGYQKTKAVLNQSDALNSSPCTQQGVQFLDSVISNYRTFNAAEFEALSANVQQLEEQRMKASIEADQKNTTSAVADRINEFMDQRIGIVRLNYQDYLTAKGSCTAKISSANDIQSATNELFNKAKITSVLLDTNSMVQLPNVTFKNLPYKSQPDTSKALEAAQIRAMVNQVQTVKELKDLGYIEFVSSKSLAPVDLSKYEEPTYKVIYKKMPKAWYYYRVTHIASENEGVVSSASGMMGPAMLVMAGVVSSDDVTGTMTKVYSGLGLASLGSLAAQLSLTSYFEQKNEKFREQVVQDLYRNKNLNDALNKNIAVVEGLYNLKTNPEYVKRRDDLIIRYKSEFARSAFQGIAKTASSSPDERVFTSKGFDFADYLVGKQILSETEKQEMAVILDFLSSNKFVANNIDAVGFQKRQAASILATVSSLAEETKDSQKRAELENMVARLKREVAVLDLLK